MSRGKPFAANAEEALQAAAQRVGKFMGRPALPLPVVEFTRAVVLDVLCVAPQPVEVSWVKLSLAAVGQLAKWVHAHGQPLTRAHVFDAATIGRYLADRAAETTMETRGLYATRLELIADTLNGVTPVERLPRPVVRADAPVDPLTDTEIADLLFWTQRLRLALQRHRLTMVVLLALGCGLTRREQQGLRREDVYRDDHGVHVNVTDPATGATRTVTCLRDYETRLWDLVETVTPRHMLLTPSQTTPTSDSSLDQSISRSLQWSPPVWWTATRLRNTWLVHHLRTGTPLKVLMDAAGYEHPTHLGNLLYLVPDPTPVETAAALRQ